MPTYEELLYDSSSDEEDEEEALMEKHGGRSSRGRAWIKEGEKDEPLDFLDTGATKRVLGVYMGCWMCTWGAGCVHGVLGVYMVCWTCAWGAGCVHGVLGVYTGLVAPQDVMQYGLASNVVTVCCWFSRCFFCS